MKQDDPNFAQVQLIANALGELREHVVFVGGCAVGLLISDPAAAPARVTYDVDLIVQVASLTGYYEIETRFEALGFCRDVSADAPICRWKYRAMVVDLMPVDSTILGFSNIWYPMAIETARSVALSAEVQIRLITAPLFLATKFEAFCDRGNRDILGSHDLEDIINVIDGRPELLDEISRSSSELQSYLADQCQQLFGQPNFQDMLPGLIFPDDFLADRVALLEQRLRSIAAGS